MALGRRLRWCVAAFGVATMLLAPSMAAAGGGTVELTASIDDIALDGADNGDPLSLGGSRSAQVEVTVTNGTSSTVDIERIRLEGTAFGVTFLAYDTLLPFTVAAGESETVGYELPLNDLRDQALGLLPASLAVFDEAGESVATQRFTIDVDGEMGSVIGVFALLVAAITGIAIGVNLFLVARRRLPPNRISRGLRFLVPGVGVGLLVALVLAIIGLLAPYPAIWPWFVLLPAGLAFALGYVSPGPLDLSDDYDEFDELTDPDLITA